MRGYIRETREPASRQCRLDPSTQHLQTLAHMSRILLLLLLVVCVFFVFLLPSPPPYPPTSWTCFLDDKLQSDYFVSACQ